jgi:hypothetical protein
MTWTFLLDPLISINGLASVLVLTDFASVATGVLSTLFHGTIYLSRTARNEHDYCFNACKDDPNHAACLVWLDRSWIRDRRELTESADDRYVSRCDMKTHLDKNLDKERRFAGSMQAKRRLRNPVSNDMTRVTKHT